MKKKLSLLIAAIFSLSLLTACGSKEPVSLVGGWDSDDYEMSLVFYEDGTMEMSESIGYDTMNYEWDGETLTVDYGGEILEGFLNDDGNLVLDGDVVFVRVEEISYYPSEDSEPIPFDITDTAWDAEGIIYNFYSDGTLIIDGEYLGNYDWDGYSGTLYIDGSSTSISYDGEDLYIAGEDGELYLMDYYSAADYDLYDGMAGGADVSEDVSEDDGEDVSEDDGGWGLAGTYDNDDEETSIAFYSDGTCAVTTLYDAAEGYYSMDDNGNLYIELDNGESAEGWYDASDDTFSLDGMSGWFYYTGSAGYTP